MKKDHTHIRVVLDRSGSMTHTADDTVGGFNTFLKDQQEAPGTANMDLIQFDHDYSPSYENRAIQTASALTRNVRECQGGQKVIFSPRGNTALLDAIGRGIGDLTGLLASMPEEERPFKVVFAIITDGHENASKEFTQDSVNKLIEAKRAEGWEFVFLAANQDAIVVGSRLGVSASNSMTYAANAEGTERAFASTGSNLRMMRSSMSRGVTEGLTMAYSASDRSAQAEALDPAQIERVRATRRAATVTSSVTRDNPEVP